MFTHVTGICANKNWNKIIKQNEVENGKHGIVKLWLSMLLKWRQLPPKL